MYFFLAGGGGDYNKIVSKFVMNSQSMYLKVQNCLFVGDSLTIQKHFYDLQWPCIGERSGVENL